VHVIGLFNLGFSWVEVGSVTPKAQSGNPQPRVFHLSEDDSIINRYGFPSVGFPLVVARLRSRLFYASQSSPSREATKILAVNLGKNKSSPPESIDDYLAGVRTLGPLADVLVINVSSPNTPGLRSLQSRGFLLELLSAVIKERDELAPRTDISKKWDKPKVVVKIAPDLREDELVGIAEAVEESKVDGVIVSNTTVQRPRSLQSGVFLCSICLSQQQC
jgi:dihydroorotate dehydrogenase